MGLFDGMQQTPQALTAPGMNPQILALLAAMQSRPAAAPLGGPVLPAPPTPVAGGVMPSIPGVTPPAGGSGILQQLMALDPNKLKQLLGGLGIGNMAALAGSGAPGAAPGTGTGGLY